VASLVGRITLGNIGPRSAGAQHPQNAVQHSATIFPRSPSSISAMFRFRNKVVQRFPLQVREVSGIRERHGYPSPRRCAPKSIFRRDSLLLHRFPVEFLQVHYFYRLQSVFQLVGADFSLWPSSPCIFFSSRQRTYCSALAGSGSSSPFSQKLNQSTVALKDTMRSQGFTRT
jgi:hypothetical protein